MADVQVEDGYTRIANALLEKVCLAKMNGCQHSIVLIVWRYTYGFNRKEHDLSSGFISNATGYNKRQVEREIGALVARKILFQKVINGVSRKLGFNKDFDSWDTPGELADGVLADGEKADGLEADTPPASKPTVTPGELADQEIHSFKDNSIDNLFKTIVPFSEIIEYLNTKADTSYKPSSKATQRHISARWNDGYRIADFQTVIDKKCAEWKGGDMEKYLCPDTLFGTKFEKYLNQKIVIQGGGNGGKYEGRAQGVQYGRNSSEGRGTSISDDEMDELFKASGLP